MSIIKPKKSLGQHFLTDGNIIRKIADAVVCQDGGKVIEIGPGTGALTGELLRRYPALEVVEIDSRAVVVLREQFPGLTIHQTDVLKVSWRGLADAGRVSDALDASGGQVSGKVSSTGELASGIADAAGVSDAMDLSGRQVSGKVSSTGELASGIADAEGERVSDAVNRSGGLESDTASASGGRASGTESLTGNKDLRNSASSGAGLISLVGNLPYYITSPILFSVLDEREQFSQAVFMMQKEVAERLVARPRTKDYGILSVQTQLWSRPEYLFTVSPHVFHPKPKVDSAVVRLHFDVAEPRSDRAFLKTLIRTAFGQRRKTLSNTLKPILADRLPDAGQRLAFGERHGLHRRAEELTPPEFDVLCQAVLSA